MCATPTCTGNACVSTFAAKGTQCDDGGGTVCDGSGHCVAAACTDNVKDGKETDVDCGGGPPCQACGDGLACTANSDCVSKVCGGTTNMTCQQPSCSDTVQNGKETDVDCGGPCPKCDDKKKCQSDADCINGNCNGGVCISCMDNVKNGLETDIDCGGPSCSACGLGMGCHVPADCKAGPNGMVTCFNNTCGFNCAPGFADCDTTVGCETDITTPAHCGSCTDTCGSICKNGTCNDPVQIAGGYEHNCAVLKDGSVFCWGQNNGGEVGDGTTVNRPAPVKVTLPAPATAIAAGGLYTALGTLGYTAHSCALLTNSSIACWGDNVYGSLGANDNAVHAMPVVAQATTNFSQVSVGGGTTCAVDAFNGLWCWGMNNFGQVGNGTNIPLSMMTGVLKPVSVLSAVTRVAVGGQHTCAIKTDGKLYCWGQNTFGQLGDGTTTSTNAPGTAVPGLTGVIDVLATRRTTCARTATDVYCWGFNGGGEVGNGSTTTPVLSPTKVMGLTGVTELALGQDTVGAITPAGVYMWGVDAQGEFGDGNTTAAVSTPTLIPGLANIAHLTMGFTSTCAITTTGQALCWGDNLIGECGNGSQNNNALTPTVVAWP
jgi:alpha-tubulin suppressor-like RCC1 family protein